jgi:hypothetical protein
VAFLKITNQAFLPKSPPVPPITIEGHGALAEIASDYNAFYGVASDPVVHWVNPPTPEQEWLTLEQWQALGQDIHSRIFDPSDPVIAANLAEYGLRNSRQVPPLIENPCCARFLFCIFISPGPPCVGSDIPLFVQHLPCEIAPEGWSDEVIVAELGFMERTYCGECDRDGLLAEYPLVYP